MAASRGMVSAKRTARDARLDWLKLAAYLGRGVRFGIEGIDMARSAVEPDQNAARPRGRRFPGVRPQTESIDQSASHEGAQAQLETVPSIESLTVAMHRHDQVSLSRHS